MRAFSGDEGIEVAGLCNFRACSTSAQTYGFDHFWATGAKMDGAADGGFEALSQIIAMNRQRTAESDGLIFPWEKWLVIFQPDGGGELRIVAELWMNIEGQMRTVNGEVVLDGAADFFVECPGKWLSTLPKHTMVNDEEIGSGGDSFANDGQGGIHSGGNVGDGAVILQLQAVDGTRIVGDFTGAEFGIEP